MTQLSTTTTRLSDLLASAAADAIHGWRHPGATLDDDCERLGTLARDALARPLPYDADDAVVVARALIADPPGPLTVTRESLVLGCLAADAMQAVRSKAFHPAHGWLRHGRAKQPRS